MMIAGQKAFATSFILVSLHSPTNVGFLWSHRRWVSIATMSVSGGNSRFTYEFFAVLFSDTFAL
jgi:hypothetical protein